MNGKVAAPDRTVLYAEFTVRPGCEQAVAGLVTSLAEDVRAEPGNERFELYVRADRPREYVVFEIYRDQQAFRDHLDSEHCQRFNRMLSPCIEGDASVLSQLRPCPA